MVRDLFITLAPQEVLLTPVIYRFVRGIPFLGRGSRGYSFFKRAIWSSSLPLLVNRRTSNWLKVVHFFVDPLIRILLFQVLCLSRSLSNDRASFHGCILSFSFFSLFVFSRWFYSVDVGTVFRIFLRRISHHLSSSQYLLNLLFI